jgi:hypothetical protein
MPWQQAEKMFGMFRPILTMTVVAVTAILIFVIAVPPPRADSGGEAICPLSKKQAENASQAFKALLPIFREPRCVNCHGAVNPFAKDTTHGGGYIDIRQEAKDFLKNHPDLREYMEKEHPGPQAEKELAQKEQERMENLANSAEEVSNSDTARKKGFFLVEVVCQVCHIRGWILPLSENFFTGRSDEWFCPHMKESLGSAKAFLAHAEKDELIQEGFKGTRGLNEDFGIPKYIEVRKQPYKPEQPTSMRYATFKQRAKDWIDAMGGKFREPKECGCDPMKYTAKIRQRWEVQADIGIVRSQLESEANFSVDLTFESEGSFFGFTTVPRQYVQHQVAMGYVCNGKGAWFETWAVAGIVNDDTHEMMVKVRFDSSPRQGQITCGPVTKSLSHPGFSSDSVSTPLSGFSLPAKVGAKRHFEWSLPPGRNTVDIEFIKARS